MFCSNTIYLDDQSLYLDNKEKKYYFFFAVLILTYSYSKFKIRKQRSNQKVVNKVQHANSEWFLWTHIKTGFRSEAILRNVNVHLIRILDWSKHQVTYFFLVRNN